MFTLTLSRMATFALFLAIGAVSKSLGILRDEVLPDFITLTLKVLLPALMVSFLWESATRQSIIEYLPMVGLTALFYPAVILLVGGMSRLLGLSGERARIFQMTFVFGNTGFIGLPLLATLFPEDGAVCFALFVLVDQVVFWTYGEHLASGEPLRTCFSARNFLNPNIVAIALGFVLAILGIPVLPVVGDVLSLTGAMASPLCLICLGAMCSGRRIVQVLREGPFWAGVAAKMTVAPIAVGLVLLATPLPHDLVSAFLVMMAMPATTLVPLAVERSAGDAEYATATTVASIAVSVASVSFVVLVLGI